MATYNMLTSSCTLNESYFTVFFPHSNLSTVVPITVKDNIDKSELENLALEIYHTFLLQGADFSVQIEASDCDDECLKGILALPGYLFSCCDGRLGYTERFYAKITQGNNLVAQKTHSPLIEKIATAVLHEETLNWPSRRSCFKTDPLASRVITLTFSHQQRT